MKIMNPLKYLSILFIINISNCFAYDGPATGGVFPIGWSEKGDIFAFGYYVGTEISPDASEMVVVIQNMVNDSILFQYGKSWERTFVGDDSDIDLPTPKDGWKEISEIVNKKLIQYNIKDGIFILNSFPYSDTFNAELRPFMMEPGYGLYIKLADGKEKMISSYSVELSGKTDNMIQGFVWDPNKNRIAVIVLIDLEYYDEFRAVGCHMTVGFKTNSK